MKPIKFEAGIILSTIPARDLVLSAKVAGQPYIMRHVRGDYGDADFKIKAANKLSGVTGKVESRYLLPNGKELAIVTDTNRKFTMFCLPGEDIEPTYLKAMQNGEVREAGNG